MSRSSSSVCKWLWIFVKNGHVRITKTWKTAFQEGLKLLRRKSSRITDTKHLARQLLTALNTLLSSWFCFQTEDQLTNTLTIQNRFKVRIWRIRLWKRLRWESDSELQSETEFPLFYRTTFYSVSFHWIHSLTSLTHTHCTYAKYTNNSIHIICIHTLYTHTHSFIYTGAAVSHWSEKQEIGWHCWESRRQRRQI